MMHGQKNITLSFQSCSN